MILQTENRQTTGNYHDICIDLLGSICYTVSRKVRGLFWVGMYRPVPLPWAVLRAKNASKKELAKN